MILSQIAPSTEDVVLAETQTTDCGQGVAAEIRLNDGSFVVRYSVSTGTVAPTLDPFVAPALYASMRLGKPLHIDGPISARLLAALPTIQEIHHSWDPSFNLIPVRAEGRCETLANPRREVGCFFSGGVDSFYTLLKHQDEITTLILVHGFDMRLDDLFLRRRVSDAVHEVAAEFGKRVVEVETNARTFSDRFTGWLEHYYGAALASVALLLGSRMERVYIPSTNEYAALSPHGSHPLLDPLWSSEATEIVHDGCEAKRVEKVLAISSCETALRWLRVCWENRNGAYNCCECEKCLRTMVSLRAAGVLDKCVSFDRPLDLRLIAQIPLTTPDSVRRSSRRICLPWSGGETIRHSPKPFVPYSGDTPRTTLTKLTHCEPSCMNRTLSLPDCVSWWPDMNVDGQFAC